MGAIYLKRAEKTPETLEDETQSIVKTMLTEIEAGGEPTALDNARRLDRGDGDVVVTEAQREAVRRSTPQAVKDDIAYAVDNVARFAEAQRGAMQGFEIELQPGLFTGQVLRPMQSVGCYVPGGRYAHIATAIMTIVTAKVAGVTSITACSPPRPGQGINPYILYTMDYCGADRILAMGGVQGIAAMTYGLFGVPPVDILVGPGNRFVAEAKRILFGKVGIDVFAGPTEIAVIADATADADVVAQDLASQAEHGLDSPAWLITDDHALAEAVLARLPAVIDRLPDGAAQTARTAWREYGEVVLCDRREAMVEHSDRYAPEHLQVHCADLDWWLASLNNYGSLFLGEETTVAFGDKCSGPNHVLPTKGAARYTGGLSVAKFVKTLTYQRMAPDGVPEVAACAARISRLEGMEAHARSGDIRLAKYFPERAFNLRHPD